MNTNNIHNVPCHRDPRGDLSVLDLQKVPFTPARVFWVQNAPKGQIRGQHAHLENKQYLVCAHGRIEVKLHDGRSLSQCLLTTGCSIFVNTLVWNQQTYLTGNDMLLVLCSQPYKQHEYITDFQTFLKLQHEGSGRNDRSQ